MGKDLICCLGEHIIIWLLKCWDNGTSSLEFGGREAKHLGSLSREKSINKLRKGIQVQQGRCYMSPRQDGHHQIPVDVISKTTPTCLACSKKETQDFLGVVNFWKMHIPNCSPLYQVIQQKNGIQWDPEQQQVFEQIKQEIVHARALGPVWAGQHVSNVVYAATREIDVMQNLCVMVLKAKPVRDSKSEI